ncbi:putative defensin-like protein 225 [Arabidopsis thaliana]|uniref:Uncharacterized protein n=1 Tax=Arabidopsis thaliana TaxID=3702 RepID=A0A5S9XST5_ARATH|nr:unnamed protein product [Arabidopsis thaliana]
MKYGVLFMVSCGVMFLILSHVEEEVEAMKKFGCNTTHPFPGKCGNNGKSSCVSDMKKLPSAPKNRDIRCECSDRPSLARGMPGERVCRCDYDC